MGFSVSAVTAIVVGVLMVSATNMVLALDHAYSEVNVQIEDQDLRQDDRLRTLMSITTYTYNATLLELEVHVENTGSLALQASEVDVLVNGQCLVPLAGRTAVDDDTTTDVWGVNEDLNLTVSVTLIPPALSSLKVVAGNGVATMLDITGGI